MRQVTFYEIQGDIHPEAICDDNDREQCGGWVEAILADHGHELTSTF